MQSRMDRYNNVESNNTDVKLRTKKNQDLYEKIKTSDIRRYDVNNNMSVIDDNIKSVDINKIHNFLDEKYGSNPVKRKSIDLPEINDHVEQEPIMDTKEYDINAIIEKAKQGKNIDYSKERLKKVREAQFEILNNLDSEIENLSSLDRAKEKRKKQEEELKHLINTITEIELQNKMKETQSDFDLLSDLKDDTTTTSSVEEPAEDIEIEDVEEETEDITEEPTEDTTPDVIIGGVQQEEDTINSKIIDEQKELDKKPEDEKKDLEKTLEKLEIDPSSYDEFSDINKKDKASIVLKIGIIIVFAALIFGVIVLLDHLLGLDLLPF